MTSFSQRARRCAWVFSFPREQWTSQDQIIMGKKSTAGSGKALAKPTQDVASNGKSAIEAHNFFILYCTSSGLTGIFHVDFVELLERQKLPPVEVRNLRKNEYAILTMCYRICCALNQHGICISLWYFPIIHEMKQRMVSLKGLWKRLKKPVCHMHIL